MRWGARSWLESFPPSTQGGYEVCDFRTDIGLGSPVIQPLFVWYSRGPDGVYPPLVAYIGEGSWSEDPAPCIQARARSADCHGGRAHSTYSRRGVRGEGTAFRGRTYSHVPVKQWYHGPQV